VSNSVLSENSSTSGPGGGIFSAGGNVMVANSTISQNSAAGDGGGVWTSGGTMTVNNSTVAGAARTADKRPRPTPARGGRRSRREVVTHRVNPARVPWESSKPGAGLTVAASATARSGTRSYVARSAS
jgi:hypothetical protein